MCTLTPSSPANHAHSLVKATFPPRWRPMAASLSHTSTRGLALHCLVSRHMPSSKSPACRHGSILAVITRE
jgi:hypothetical protein